MKQLSFTKLYEQTFRDNFELPALSDYGNERIFTYEDIAEEIEKLHLLFKECNIKQEDKIALIGKNNSRWCITYLAVVTYGAVLVPVLQDFSSDDIHHIINHSESSFLFIADSLWQNLEKDKIAGIRGVISLTDFSVLFQRENKISELFAQSNEQFVRKYPSGFTKENINYIDLQENKVVVLNYTSGTTGFTKGVMITGENLTGNIYFACDEMPLVKGNKIVSLLPLAHAYGAAFDFLYPLVVGCHVTLLGKTPSPQVLLKAFNEIKPSLIIVVPLVLEKIYKRMIQPVIEKKWMRLALNIPLLNTFIYTKIRNQLVAALGGNFIQVVIGGAPLNSEVEDFLLKIKFPVSVGYGMTECAPLISFSLYPKYVPHSCGKVLPCIQVRIDSEDPYSIAGEIQVKGQNVMAGYYKNEELNKNTFTDDGWLRTGDLGTIDSNYNIFIRGRSKSMILSASGQNIYPEEIEAKLDNLPFVSESIVVDRDGRLVALVYPDKEALEAAGISDENLTAIMNENKETLNKIVSSYEKIAEIQLYPNEFEKTPKKSIKRFLYH